MNCSDDYINAFKAHSIKLTPQRLAIFNLLIGNTSHPSAEELYKSVVKVQPNISFATVYNTLDKLVEIGLLQKLDIDEEKKHYDPDISQHHHFLCKKCREIIDVFKDFNISLNEDELNIKQLNNYQVYFYGICNNCEK